MLHHGGVADNFIVMLDTPKATSAARYWAAFVNVYVVWNPPQFVDIGGQETDVVVVNEPEVHKAMHPPGASDMDETFASRVLTPVE
jgi:hypothetical protein